MDTRSERVVENKIQKAETIVFVDYHVRNCLEILFHILLFLIKQFTFERVIHIIVQCSKGIKRYIIRSNSLLHS